MTPRAISPADASPLTNDSPATAAPAEGIGELVEELLAGWNGHDVERVVACYAPTYEGMDLGEATTRHGVIGLRKTLRRWFRAFPDLQIAQDALIIQENRAALSWIITGTHAGVFMRIPATQRPVTIQGVSLMTVGDGQIVSASRMWDMAAFLRNVGLLPDLQRSAEE